MVNSVNILLEQSFKNNWDRDALSNFNGETATYGQIASVIAELHILYGELGIYKGDKIALCSRNQSSWGVAYLSILTYGAVAVPLLHEFKPANIHNLVNHSGSRVLFIGDNFINSVDISLMPGLELVINLKDLSIIHIRNNRDNISREFIKELMHKTYPTFGRENLSFYKDSPEELAVINYTSGTTGFSKGVMLPYRALLSNILFAGEVEPQMNCNTRVVSMLPSAHMYGMMFEFLFEMTIGAHVFFLTRLPSPNVILNSLQKVKPGIIITVPMVIEKIYKKMILPRISEPKVKLMLGIPGARNLFYRKIRKSLYEALGGNFHEVIIGGAAFNHEVETFLKRIKFPFTVGYGMTECAPIVTYIPWKKTRIGTCGKAAPRMEIKIDSPQPSEIPGEVLLKGDNVFLGYYRNEAATGASFDSDGWFKTGDLGILDADGFLSLKGRSKSMILGPSGQNIYPEELESVINNIAMVCESLVIDKEGVLTALVFPDYEQAEVEGLDNKQLLQRISREIASSCNDFPNYYKINNVILLSEEFEKTPKKSIKRYLYQNG